MSKSKAKGTWAESALREYFRQNGWAAKRNALTGSKDEGDLDIHPQLAIEIKNVEIKAYPQWMRELETERINSGARYGILLVKPMGIGERRIGMWHALMFMSQFRELLSECRPELKHLPPDHIETWVSIRLDALLGIPSVADLNKQDIHYVSWRPRGYTLASDDGKYFCAMNVASLMKVLSAAGYRPEVSREG